MKLPHRPSRRAKLEFAFRLTSMALAFCAGGARPCIGQADDTNISGQVDDLVSTVSEDPSFLLPSQPVETILGFNKSLQETPRSATLISGEMINQYNINELVDLSRFAPSTYTAFSFGIQGSVDIRGDGGDAYYRGMKRINNGSNMPTIIGASDGITIVRGPPMPVNGAGRVGGYVDYLPRSARARTGRYLEHDTGKITATFGSYGKKFLSAEIGGPLKVFGRPAGFYLYGQAEDSDSFYQGSFTRQLALQGTLTLDLSEALRLETGFNYQVFHGTGLAGWNRVTQDLIDERNYVTGVPLRDLDTDADHVLSYSEIRAAGDLNKTISLTGPRPTLPIGYALDPATVGTVRLSPRQVLVEREGYARDYIFFADLVNDSNPALVFRSKFFTEYQRHHKLSDIAYFRAHEAYVAEQKFTAEWNPPNLPEWLRLTALASINGRYLDTYNKGISNEQIFNRWDLTLFTDGHYGIANGWETPALAGPVSPTKSRHLETGAGLLIDATFFGKTNVVLGGRFDHVRAQVWTPANGDYASGSDSSPSLSSISISHEIIKGVRPYLTYARPRTIIPGSSGGLTISKVRGEILEPTELAEAGIKASLFENKLYLAVSAFKQFRSSYNSTLDVYQSTTSRGVDFEARWVPNRTFNLALACDFTHSVLDPLTAQTVTVSPQIAGYDPADAYGGRLSVSLPIDSRYARRNKPPKVLSLFGNYAFGKGWDVSLGTNYQGAFPASLINLTELPAALTFSGSIGYANDRWEVRLSGRNLTNELYFQSTSSNWGEEIVIPAVGRMWDIKTSWKF